MNTEPIPKITGRGIALYISLLLTGFSASFGVMFALHLLAPHWGGVGFVTGVCGLFFFGFLFYLANCADKLHPGKFFKFQ